MYKLIKNSFGEPSGVSKTEYGVTWYIPLAPDNTDYQAYLKWLDEGNTPEPADE